MQNKLRDIKFDVVKTLAIYLVVYGHLLETLTSTKIYLITFCHMPAFFFVSGYFYNESVHKYSYKQLLKKKVTGLLYPYLMWSFISYIANLGLMLVNQGRNITFRDIINEFVTIFLFSRSVWYLIELFLVMTLFLLFFVISNKLHVNLLLVSVGGWFLISIIAPSDIFSFYKFKWLFPFFLLGYYINENKEKFTVFKTKMFPSAALIIGGLYLGVGTIVYNEHYFAMYCMFDYISMKSIFMGLIYYGLSVFSVLFLFGISYTLEETRIGKILAQMGNYTIDIYVIHMFLIKFIVWIPKEIDGNILSFIWLPVYAIIIMVGIFFFSKYVFRRSAIYRFSIGER